MVRTVVIALDDWMIWARDESGQIVETCSEMWPEWLDERCAPEDMPDEEFKKATLRILRTKAVQWQNTKEYCDESTRRFAQIHDRIADAAELASEWAFVESDILELETKQAEFINSNR